MGGINHATKSNARRTSEGLIMNPMDLINDHGFTSNASALGDLIIDMQHNPSSYTMESVTIAKGVFGEVTRGLEMERKDYSSITSIVDMFRSL